MDIANDAQGPLDPRIQIELENLNTATDDINKLEIELDEAETSFKHWQSESLKKLIAIMNKIGAGHIEKARCYYDALKLAQQAQLQSQHQAHLFERASEIHATARETVALAEAKFISHRHELNFDQAWQDMLNHATIKVRDAEDKKAICGREHQIKTMLFEEKNKRAQQLEEKYRRAIIKTRPFFEQQDIYEQEVSTQEAKISCLEKAIKEAKRAYSRSFRALEEISNEIHQQRRDYVVMVNGPREPGVGAELISSEKNLNNNKKLIQTNSSIIGGSDPIPHGSARNTMSISGSSVHMENIDGRSADGRESTSDQWELEMQASIKKLNTLTFQNQIENWGRQLRNENVFEISNYDGDRSSNMQNNMIDDSSSLHQVIQYDCNRLEKLPTDSHTSIERKNESLNDNNGVDHNYGWQSLTQNPVMPRLIKSKMNQNSVSNESNCNETPTSMNLTSVNSHDTTIIANSTIIDGIIALKHNQKDPNDINDNIDLLTPMKENETTLSSIMNGKKNHLCNRTNDGNSICSNNDNSSPIELNEHFILNGGYSSENLGNDTGSKFVDNPKFKNASCKISSIRELPLLSMFEGSIEHRKLKDRSSSMMNLSEEQNSKLFQDNSMKDNIRAISVEKLANAWHII